MAMRKNGFMLFLAPLILAAVAHAGIKPPRTVNPNYTPDPICIKGSTTLCVPLGSSFTTVTFPDAADPGDVCQRNDDGSSVELTLPFTFNLYGTNYTSCYINNNGNISFEGPVSSFSSTGFPTTEAPMVAGLWADVDSRGPNSGVVHYLADSHKLVVIWERVGYFGTHDDKLNTFEIILSDGTDPVVGTGSNVCLCYDDMQWTTGDASDGLDGFGGTPATVGANKGDGTNFFQVGRFDHAGTDYDGPAGNVDGIDYLDHRSLCFSVATTGGSNLAPVPQGFPLGNVVKVCPESLLVLETSFISPEIGQTTTTVVDLHGLAHASVTSDPGNPSLQTLRFTPAVDQPGPYTVSYVATDDGTPPASRTVDLTILVECPVPVLHRSWGALKSLYR